MSETRKERGAAAVEMAFMTVFLLVLVTGIIDIGRAIYTNISVQEAAQEGAMYGGFEADATAADIVDRAVDSTTSISIDGTDVTVTCTTITRGKRNATRVEVGVDYQLDLVTPLIGDWLSPIDLHKTAKAERFFVDCPAGT